MTDEMPLTLQRKWTTSPRGHAERMTRVRGRRLPPAYYNKQAYIRQECRAEIAGARAP